MSVIGLLVGGCLLVGAALLFYGWRGRRVGQHLHCRQCEFDLFGLPEDAAACPECGHDLTTSRARVRGARRRRRWPIAIGLVLWLTAGSLGGLTAWSRTSTATFYAYAPSAYLVWVVDDSDARDELATRLRQGNLTAATTTQLVDRALDVQADHARPWDDTWGRLVEDAHAAGHLSDVQVDRYIRQAITLTLHVRPRVQLGREPDGHVTLVTPLRVGPNTTLHATFQATGLWVEDPPVALPSNIQRRLGEFSTTSTGHSGLSSHLPLAMAGHHVGNVPIEVEVETTISAVVIAGQPFPHSVATPPERLATTVLVEETPTGNYLRGELPPAAQIDRAGVWIESRSSNSDERQLVFSVVDQPVEPRFKAWLRIGDETLSLDGFSGGGGSRSETVHHAYRKWSLRKIFNRHPELAGSTHGDLIVRPDIDVAETSTAMHRVWLGEWTFEDVPLDAQAEPEQHRMYAADELPTLVRPRTRLLTLEQAELTPTAEPGEPEED